MGGEAALSAMYSFTAVVFLSLFIRYATVTKTCLRCINRRDMSIVLNCHLPMLDEILCRPEQPGLCCCSTSTCA